MRASVLLAIGTEFRDDRLDVALGADRAGESTATGLPRLVIVMVSPCSTLLSNRGKWVLAS